MDLVLLGVQQVALKAQGHRRHWVNNGLTRLCDIDVEDLLAVDALQAGL